MTAHATYQLLSTLFIATSKYASSIEGSGQSAKTYRSIAMNFYEPMLQVLARSFYSYYTRIDESGYIFLNDKVLNNEWKIRLSREVIRDIKSIDSATRWVFSEVQPSYINESDTKVLMSIKQSMLRIRAFASILSDDVYLKYQLTPFVSQVDGNGNVPKISEDNNSIVVWSTEYPVEKEPAKVTSGALQEQVLSLSGSDAILSSSSGLISSPQIQSSLSVESWAIQ